MAAAGSPRFPNFPGVCRMARHRKQAVEKIMNAIACRIEAAEEDGRLVPVPASADT